MKIVKVLFAFLMCSTLMSAQTTKSSIPAKTKFYQATNYQKKIILSKAIEKGFIAFLVPEEVNSEDIKAFFGERIEIDMDGRIAIIRCNCTQPASKCSMRIKHGEEGSNGSPAFSCSGCGGGCKLQQGELPRLPNDPEEILTH